MMLGLLNLPYHPYRFIVESFFSGKPSGVGSPLWYVWQGLQTYKVLKPYRSFV